MRIGIWFDGLHEKHHVFNPSSVQAMQPTNLTIYSANFDT